MGGETWEIKFYRNRKLKKYIEDNFDEVGQAAAWKVVAYLKDEYPDIIPIIRGEEM